MCQTDFREGFQNPNGEIDLLLEYPLEFFFFKQEKTDGEGIHSKSEKVCGVCFSVTKESAEKVQKS